MSLTLCPCRIQANIYCRNRGPVLGFGKDIYTVTVDGAVIHTLKLSMPYLCENF